MTYSGYGTGAITAHEHSAAAGEGGVLSLTRTRIDNLSPISLTVGLGG